LSEKGNEAAAELLELLKSGRGKWYEIARLELSIEERTEIRITGKSRDFGGVQNISMEAMGRGHSGESEWNVFKSMDDAEKYAEDYVEEQLQEDPSLFNQKWLQHYLTVSDTDKRLISSEEADNYVEGLEDERILEESDLQDEWDEVQEDIDELEMQQEDADDKAFKRLQAQVRKLEERQESIVEKGREVIRENYAETIRDRLEDPLDYAEELGFDIEREGLPAWISIDTEEAAKAAINEDGVAHFLDGYDGSETELPSGAVAFGTN